MKHDYVKLRHISILSVAHALSMELVRTGGETWNRREGKKITSLTLFTKTNTFYRFSGKTSGGVCGGSPLDLVMHARDCSLQEAAQFLTSHFL
ncbi:MAG: hypothetical protein PHZ00_01990 [Candidatus Peribacteraceae bacterium]|nr:hypothetical protein [Candidatus Peribacteraceae bacterium]